MADAHRQASDISENKAKTGTKQSTDPNLLLIMKCIWDGNVEDLKKVIDEHKSDPPINGLSLIDQSFRGMTPLIMACQLGRLECTKLLLKNKADTLLPSALGYYPVQEATSAGNRSLIKVIIERRHEQLRALWHKRQPILANSIQEELGDFFMEMDWHFTSWIPFLSRFCPSDKCKIWKWKNKIRLDSTLVGIEVEKFDWIKGNVSYLFEIKEKHSQMVILDHDRQLYEVIDKTNAFDDRELEEEINLHMNSKIYRGKVKKINCSNDDNATNNNNNLDESGNSNLFVREKDGFFGWGDDKCEEIGGYKCRVYCIPDIQVTAQYRSEHLKAKSSLDLDDGEKEELDPSTLLTNVAINNEEDAHSDENSLDQEEQQENVKGIIKDVRDNLLKATPSLEPPPSPPISKEEFFNYTRPQNGTASKTQIEECTQNNKTYSIYHHKQGYIHLGRPLLEASKSKKVSPRLWMSSQFPLSAQQLKPFLELLTSGSGSKSFQKLGEFMGMDLPPGFPVQIEIPIFAFLQAKVKFGGWMEWDDDGADGTSSKLQKPQFCSKIRKDRGDWFEVPPSYKPGIVIKNVLKNSE